TSKVAATADERTTATNESTATAHRGVARVGGGAGRDGGRVAGAPRHAGHSRVGRLSGLSRNTRVSWLSGHAGAGRISGLRRLSGGSGSRQWPAVRALAGDGDRCARGGIDAARSLARRAARDTRIRTFAGGPAFPHTGGAATGGLVLRSGEPHLLTHESVRFLRLVHAARCVFPSHFGIGE